MRERLHLVGSGRENSDSAYDKARDIYEGSYMKKGEVERSFAQRRAYADFDQLCASGVRGLGQAPVWRLVRPLHLDRRRE